MEKANNLQVDNLPLVSVIIPVYNSQNYIAETISNVLQQTYKNLEILIIDDGSVDNSLSIIKTLQNEKVRIFSQPNNGASSARNYGLREAKGVFIQFLDADDLLSANKIEDQVNLLVNNMDKVSVCPTVHFTDGENYVQLDVIHEWYQEKFDNTTEFLIKLYGGYGGSASMIQPNAWLTPRSIIDKAGFWNEEITVDDDGEFFCRVLLASGGTRYAPNAINYYRKFNKGNNLSSQKSKKAFESMFLSTSLKCNQLLAVSNSAYAKMAMATQYLELAVNCYPQFKFLSSLAEAKSKELGNCPKKYYTHTTFYRTISFLFGWKASAFISFTKLKLTS